jgi:hypothetical protein
MAKKRCVRPRIGDVVRITAMGGASALAQFTHRHVQYGALLRVLGPAPDDARLADDAAAAEFAARPTQFLAFFPLGAACHRGIAEIIGEAPVPREAQAFPIFRSALPLREGGRGSWWLWDGVREWRVGGLDPGPRGLPLRGIMNDTLLVERAQSGWRHDQDV